MKAKITEDALSEAVTGIIARADDELFASLYAHFCEKWEEQKNGRCCVVERVRDKYLMPKIKEFLKAIKSERKGGG